MVRRLRPPGASLPTLLLVPLVSLSIVACGGSNGDSGSGGQEPRVGGTVACDRSSVEKGVEAWAEAYGNGESASLPNGPGAFRCAEGWAVAFPEVGPKAEAVTVTVVLEAEGQFWIPKDRSKVCGGSAASSEVPEPLYRDACQTN